MLHPKFIIEGENLILGKCEYHKHLATNKENVKGGGWFRFDAYKHAFILGGKSFDFGYADIEDIRTCVQKGNVFKDKNLTRNLQGFHFIYDTQSELIELN